MKNLITSMTPAYFERVIAKLAKVDDIERVIHDDEHLLDFRRLEIIDGPMSVTADVSPDGSIRMIQYWCGSSDIQIGGLMRTITPSGEMDHDVGQIKAILNKAVDGCDAAYIQTKYPTFWKALDRITTDLDVPFIGGLHRRHPLQLQWIMSEHGETCISIDIGIDSVQISNSWNDDTVILRWPAWLFSGRDRNKYNPPSFEDLMSLIMRPIHGMIIDSMDELCDCTEYFSDYSDFYKIFTYSEIVINLCTNGDAQLIEESVDYDALLTILPSMDSTYYHRKAEKEQS